MRTLLITLGATLALLLSACSDASSTDTGTNTASSDAGSATSKPSTSKPSDQARHARAAKANAAPGRDGHIPKSCAITRKQVQLVVRDWERVVGSIDRPDHADYTGPFTARISRLLDERSGCPGDDSLHELGMISGRIDTQVSKPGGIARLAAYNRAEASGDAWMRKLGFTTTRMPVG